MWLDIDSLDDDDSKENKLFENINKDALLSSFSGNLDSLFNIKNNEEREELIRIGREAFRFIKKNEKIYIATSSIAAYAILLGKMIEAREKDENKRVLILIALESFGVFLTSIVNNPNDSKMEVIEEFDMKFINSKQFYEAMKNTFNEEIPTAVKQYVKDNENNDLPLPKFNQDDFDILNIFSLTYLQLEDVGKLTALEL